MHIVPLFLTTDAALRALVQAFIHYRLDYCNALPAGTADSQMKRLQTVQNSAAYLMSGAVHHDHITLDSGAAESFSRPRSLCENIIVLFYTRVWVPVKNVRCRPRLPCALTIDVYSC